MPRTWSLVYKVLLLGLSGLVTTTAVFADFRVELDGSYSEIREGEGSPDEVDVAATVYLQPVKDTTGPLGEAAFLARASSLQYSYSRDKFDSADVPRGPAGEALFDRTPTSHGLSARYVVPDSGWIFSLAGARPETFDTDTVDIDGWSTSIGVGRYLSATTSIELFVGYSTSDSDFRSSQPCGDFLASLGCAELAFDSDGDIDTTSVSALYRRVGKIGRHTFATSAGIGYAAIDIDTASDGPLVIGETGELVDGLGIDSSSFRSSASIDDNWNAFVAGTWFVTREIGIDAGLDFETSDGEQDYSFNVGVGWFVTPNVELRGNYSVGWVSQFDQGPRQWRATLRTRF